MHKKKYSLYLTKEIEKSLSRLNEKNLSYEKLASYVLEMAYWKQVLIKTAFPNYRVDEVNQNRITISIKGRKYPIRINKKSVICDVDKTPYCKHTLFAFLIPEFADAIKHRFAYLE